LEFGSEMNIYKELEVIDRFEEKFGNSTSVTRACDLMVSYLAGLKRRLPETAARGLRVAIKYRQGLASLDELGRERKAISDFLRERSARTNYSTPEYCIMHAVDTILQCYQTPVWGGGASELVSNFLDTADRFESDRTLMRRLLQQNFPEKNGQKNTAD
jgi:hypothetical protein